MLLNLKIGNLKYETLADIGFRLQGSINLSLLTTSLFILVDYIVFNMQMTMAFCYIKTCNMHIKTCNMYAFIIFYVIEHVVLTVLFVLQVLVPSETKTLHLYEARYLALLDEVLHITLHFSSVLEGPCIAPAHSISN